MRNILIIEGVITQVLGVVLLAALLTARPRSIANRLLALGILCMVSRQFLIMMKVSGAILSFPMLFRLSFPFQLLAIPALYLYVVALTTHNFRLERKHTVHLIPFFVGLAWYIGVLVWGSPLLFEPGLTYEREVYARDVVILLVIVPYLMLVRQRASAFEWEAKQHVSEVGHLKLRWLRTLLFVAYVAVTLDLLEVATGPRIKVWHLAPSIGVIAFVSLAYVSLRASRVLAWEVECNKAESVEGVPSPDREPGEEGGKGRLSDDELVKQKERLIRVLTGQSLYLNPELRLSDLADAMGIRPYRVSEILSRGLQTSFYDLVNGHRVAKAQELLSSKKSEHLNLLGVAMESGFRSKSVFNDVFKKETGMTPSQYRLMNATGSADHDIRIAR